MPPWIAVINTEPAGGGPRPLPGTAAGSLDDASTLVSAVAPSDGGGAMGLTPSVAGEPFPAPEVPVAGADELIADRSGDGSDPAMSCGPALLTFGLEMALWMIGALALTTNVGAAAEVVGSAAVVVIVGAELVTSVVVALPPTVVVVDETVVPCAGSVTVVTSGPTI
jgi:hypothetical protein